MARVAYYPGTEPLLVGYDPANLPKDHLVRWVEQVVEGNVRSPDSIIEAGRPSYDPRLLIKVLLYGYATGIRSSRQLERLCQDSLAYLYLTRGAAPSYHTLCSARVQFCDELELCWASLIAVAAAAGIKRIGRIDIDSTKIRANVSSESVLKASEFAFVLDQLKRILAEAQQMDAKEDAEGASGQTLMGKEIACDDHMREVLRKIRKAMRQPNEADRAAEVDARRLGPRMLPKIRAAIETLETVPDNQKHVSLTDPDAQMMPEGRMKKIQECHSFEVAADNGLLVCARSSQTAADCARIEGLVEAAKANEPDGVNLVVADSGYWGGEAIARIEDSGIATCIPDPLTARSLRCGLQSQAAPAPDAAMTYEPDEDRYRCSQGRLLRFVGQRRHGAGEVKVYRAVQDCLDCPVRAACMTQQGAKRRTLKIPIADERIRALKSRFADPEHQRIYHERGKNVETVFAVLRGSLNIRRWYLRGKEKVAAEAAWIAAGLQLRKIHSIQTRAAAKAPQTA